MASRALGVLLCLLVVVGGLAAGASAGEARRIARVIGNATYESAPALEAAGRGLTIGDLLTVDDFAGDAGSLDLRVEDDRAGATVAQFSIEVEGQNAPPRVAEPRRFELPPIQLGIEPPVDPDGDRLTIRVDEVPEIGTLRAGQRVIGRGDTLSPEELAALVVEPDRNRIVGDFAYTARDPAGASGSTAIRFDIGLAPGSAVGVAPSTAAAPPPAATSTQDGAAPGRDAFEPFRVVQTANVRAGPDADTERLATLRAGTVLKVFDKPADTNWYEVETLEGQRGYIYAELVEPVPASEFPSLDPDLRPTIRRASATAETIGGSFRDCEVCPLLVPIAGGSFQMGSTDGHRSAQPVHRVNVDRFAIGQYEVTVGEWRACVAAGGCTPQDHLVRLDPDLPAHDLSWQDAQAYVGWLREQTGEPYRLPSEAEWEYAHRGGTQTRFWWGDEVGIGNANCLDCGGAWSPSLPAPVESFLANPYQLHGTSGGVMEWVQDCWFANHQGAPDDGRAREEAGCERRVLRGGSWQNDHTYATSASRLGYDAGVRYLANGFRVARDLE
jgi:formylglycine-generating enzyme required for sulfatase activity